MNTILITAARGAIPFLENELREIGFNPTNPTLSSVEVTGEFPDVYKLNLHLRTAHRVLWSLLDVKAKNADQLHAGLRAFPWEQWLHSDGYICVTSHVENATIRDPRFANLRVKDAIVDRMQETSGRRPNSGSDRDRAVVHLQWLGDNARIFLDTSGESLNRRSYRLIPLQAPMMETLAACCLLATPWTTHLFSYDRTKKDESPTRKAFINPMCGAGTLAIEAALIAANIPPGSLRKNFGFMHVKPYRETDWKKLRDNSPRPPKSLPNRIIATDISPKAVDAARQNARRAGVEHLIEFAVCDFRETPVPPGGGVVMFNPEYGERLGDEKALEPTYKAIGDFLKQKCSGYTGYVFTGNLALARKIGLRSSRRLTLYNAKLECRLLEFEMYEGTRDP